MFKEFKEFAMKGNVLDMAIGIVIGGAFGTIVKSLVSDVIMPPIGLLLGGVDFSNLFAVVKAGDPAGSVHGSGRRPGGGCGDRQLRPLHQQRHQFPDRRPGGLHVGQVHQRHAARRGGAAGRADDQGLSLLRDGDRHQGDPLPELHLGGDGG